MENFVLILLAIATGYFINRLNIFFKSFCCKNKTTVRIGNNNKATILLERK